MERIIKNMDIILTLMQNNTLYLNYETIGNLILDYNLKIIIETNIKNINGIYSKLKALYIFYKSISYEDRKSNLQINLLLCELLYRYSYKNIIITIFWVI